MRGPLPAVTVCYVCGVLVSARFEVRLEWLFGCAFALAIPTLLSDRARPVLLLPFVSIAAAVNTGVGVAVLSPHDLRLLQEERVELCAIRGVIANAPVYRVHERHSKPVWKSITRVRVTQIKPKGGDWQNGFGLVAVSTPGTLGDEFFAGQEVEIYGVLGPPRRRVADGLFDYREYLYHHQIYYQLIVERADDWVLLNPDAAIRAPPVSYRFSQWAQKVLARGLPDGDASSELLRAMALGWKTALTDEVSEPFMQSGTLHVFAISGLHVALIATILVSLARLAQLPRAWCGMFIIPALWFYAAATGWQPSAIRSTIMMSVIIAGWSLRRPPELLNSLAAASLIILVWEPRQLFQAGFQLSFFVVLSIALILPPLERWRQRLVQPDPFLPPELRPWWQRRLDGPIRYITTSAATSLAAWLGSLPIVAYYFHLVTPVSLLANLLIVPLSGAALASCLGSLICGDWLISVGELFNHSAWFWMECMVLISHWAARLPGAYFYVPSPALIHFLVYYGALIGVSSGWLLASRFRRWFSTGGAVCVAAWFAWDWNDGNQCIRITVMPMGGAGIYVDAAGGKHDLLIDCGNESAAEFVLKPFLRAQGATRIPTLVLTHGDVQHVGGFDVLRKQFSMGEIVASSIRFRSPVYRKIASELAQTPGSLRHVHRGDAVSGLRVLHPESSDRFGQADDNAIVLWMEMNGASVLLLSDLGKLGQRQLMEREPQLRADIMIAGLPAQGEPVEAQLLDAIAPRVLIIASADYPVSSQASRVLRNRLGKMGIPVIYTSDSGAASVEIRSGKWRVRTIDGQVYGGERDGR